MATPRLFSAVVYENKSAKRNGVFRRIFLPMCSPATKHNVAKLPLSAEVEVYQGRRKEYYTDFLEAATRHAISEKKRGRGEKTLENQRHRAVMLLQTERLQQMSGRSRQGTDTSAQHSSSGFSQTSGGGSSTGLAGENGLCDLGGFGGLGELGSGGRSVDPKTWCKHKRATEARGGGPYPSSTRYLCLSDLPDSLQVVFLTCEDYSNYEVFWRDLEIFVEKKCKGQSKDFHKAEFHKTVRCIHNACISQVEFQKRMKRCGKH